MNPRFAEYTVKEVREALEKLPDDAKFQVYMNGWWSPKRYITLPIINVDRAMQKCAIIQVYEH